MRGQSFSTMALLTLLAFASSMSLLSGVSAQDFAGSLFTTDIFEDIPANCSQSVLSSRELMGAYQSCGGMALFALPYMPYKVILDTHIMPSFCSTNCTERLQSLRALGDGVCAPTNLPQGLFRFPTSTSSIEPGQQFNLLELVGGITIPTIIDILETIKKASCVPIDASINKDPTSLTKEDFCLYDNVNAAKPKLETRSYNVTLLELASDKDLVCNSCWAKMRNAFDDKSVQQATLLYNRVKDAVTALQDTQTKSCDPKSLQPKN
ncbi:hypothetical protein BC829DRAFT_399586 [Chytridium lagenaria]|nr:hypothetical protein BC829DRAFT_399586 [Chytridium lagenaria]